MITENVSTLQIHKLTQEQYEIALENGELNDNSIYLTPTEIKDYILRSEFNEYINSLELRIKALENNINKEAI